MRSDGPYGRPEGSMGGSLRFGSGNDSQRSRDEIRIIKEMLSEELETFLVENRIDAPAGRELRNEAPPVQLAVLDRGPLRSCTNPSGALVGRIRDAKRGLVAGGRPGNSAPVSSLSGSSPGVAGTGDGELDRFCADNRIDQGAMMSLRAESLDVQRAVMAMGPLVNATNPSAALMGRIRSAKTGVQTYRPPGQGHPGTGPSASPAGLGATPAAPPALADATLADATMLAIAGLKATANDGGGVQGNGNSNAGFSAGGANTAQKFESTEDTRLQQEALKAIEMLNAANEDI
mmetsp:Transcript_17903/g.39320  ORF Transcript_17903/g.39320 Transcript_17903/m.39320 type:complete len:290 (-) Transcript_17903:88-957(-)|eukprot:CAMPEP_0170627496 /NCGR_PEP_ID=MMETSP0224-20130122/32007_1 /TAXON_ID=285029 /ORGANISM="Togula jolla, Strain CCCM 725" /LENGTH=289 /DNA_ID=CAMNT_0010954509 /DNA_START=41 /DNA_END=910 /DNA_ORIENTATION=-